MKTLVFSQYKDKIRYAFFTSGKRNAVLNGEEEFNWDDETRRDCLDNIRSVLPDKPQLIALRALFGGMLFEGPATVSPDSIEKLESLITQAPLHTPRLLALLDTCRQVFWGTPAALVFDTSFFTSLPEREHSYGLDPEIIKKLNIRRYGYHGIYHEAACAHAAKLLRNAGKNSQPRIISICLQPKPEIAALRGHNPIMVTSGATPLEGLPGQTSCGDLDPSVVLTIAEKKGWGPERIDRMLTRESGLLGLTGENVSLDEILSSSKNKNKLAREILEHRILLACGSAKAALGGVDALVFSGEFAEAGEMLAATLSEKLASKESDANMPPACYTYRESLTRIVADMAVKALKDELPAFQS